MNIRRIKNEFKFFSEHYALWLTLHDLLHQWPAQLKFTFVEIWITTLLPKNKKNQQSVKLGVQNMLKLTLTRILHFIFFRTSITHFQYGFHPCAGRFAPWLHITSPDASHISSFRIRQCVIIFNIINVFKDNVAHAFGIAELFFSSHVQTWTKN